MIEQLFGSKTRVKLLQLFYNNPNRSFYVREITRKVDEQINSVRRELANLLSIGIIKSESNNNRLYYEVDQSYDNYKALSLMFGPKSKTVKKKDESESVEPAVPENSLAKSLRSTGRIELAILTGKFTRDETSGIDLLLVGDINQSKLSAFVNELEKEEKKEIRYTSMPLTNYHYRLQINDRFINNVLAAKKQIIINDGVLSAQE